LPNLIREQNMLELTLDTNYLSLSMLTISHQQL
jgi:hypothetical protein